MRVVLTNDKSKTNIHAFTHWAQSQTTEIETNETQFKLIFVTQMDRTKWNHLICVCVIFWQIFYETDSYEIQSN